MDDTLKSWMAFAVQKLEEISTLSQGLNHGLLSVQSAIEHSDAIARLRKASPKIHTPKVKKRCDAISDDMVHRQHPFAQRIVQQSRILNLPLFPTTTIGSFPQTPEIRKSRAAFKAGKINQEAYTQAMHDEIKYVIAEQIKLDLDVLVHGEPERNDMVEYFGEQLEALPLANMAGYNPTAHAV